uniref:Uncharacterized protein n=1 Tax=Amphora coffeiformis TaxID=265554 RepID=A0A7S3LE24_9STRA
MMKLYSTLVALLGYIAVSESRNLRTYGSGTCPNKKVRITMFKIEGNVDAGDAEIKLTMMGRPYFPGWRNTNYYCGYRTDYCEFAEGKYYPINGQWKAVAKHRVLTVGATEVDVFSDDNYGTGLRPSEWYSDTCETYEIIIADPFDPAKSREACYEASAGGDVKGVELGGSIKSCTSWTDPAESMIWHVEIAPA